jgi:hypothetical protein
MRHYSLKEVLVWVATCNRLGCVPLEYYDKFSALVDQANRADEMERRYEQAMGIERTIRSAGLENEADAVEDQQTYKIGNIR